METRKLSTEQIGRHVFAIAWAVLSMFCLVGFIFSDKKLPIIATMIVTLCWAVSKMIVEGIDAVKALSVFTRKK